jgi:hypothetical protein
MPWQVGGLFGGPLPAAVGDGWVVVQKDGTWKQRRAQDPRLAWASAKGTVYLATTDGKVMRSDGDGDAFHDAHAPIRARLLAGSADDDVYVAGSQGIAHFDGTKWSDFASELDATHMLASPDDLWIITQPHP